MDKSTNSTLYPSTLSKLNVGEFEARREFKRDRGFFLSSFVKAPSFSVDLLSNRKNFLVIGRKGAGKTACQIYTQQLREKEGYKSASIIFTENLRKDSLAEMQRSQSSIIDISEIKPGTDLTLLYNFRPIWRRAIFLKIAEVMECVKADAFTKFCLGSNSGSKRILDGIKKGFKVEIKVPLGPILSTINYDGSDLTSNEVTVDTFNDLASKLFVEHGQSYKIYLFVDELVISSLNTRTDEYKVRLALIRDLIFECADFNDLCAEHDIDCHVIATLRPEVKQRINKLDAELSKVTDGNSAKIDWHGPNGDKHPLIELMLAKLRHNDIVEDGAVARKLFSKWVDFNTGKQRTFSVLLNNSWYRPRDFVRYLTCFQNAMPNEHWFSEDVIKAGMIEYSKISATEMIGEMAVLFDTYFIDRFQSLFPHPNFNDLDQLYDEVSFSNDSGASFEEVAQCLFEIGVLENVTETGVAAGASENRDELMSGSAIRVHTGLWGYFGFGYSGRQSF